MQTASLFSWRWMKPTFSVENISMASDALVSGLSAWLSVVAADVGGCCPSRCTNTGANHHKSCVARDNNRHGRLAGISKCCSAQQRGVYHAVIVHAHEFVDSVDLDIHTETIEGLWMQAKCKLRYQSGTSRVCLPATWRPFSGVTVTNRMCWAAICKWCAPITIFSS